MARGNTLTSYGAVTKSFHWLTALLILSMIPLGFFANQLAYQIKDPSIPTTGEDIARVAWLFSLHKTVGVALFFTALARITWAISQPKPKLLNGDKPLEAFAASTVHWVLYSALVIVPLSGWIHHASTTGFAPIWWPFGQSLPFVPKDGFLAEQTAIVHWLSCIVLVGALVLHIGGAIKHHVIDQDATLRRMLPGRAISAEPTENQPGETLPVFAAVAAWAAVIFIGGSLTLADQSVETVAEDTATLENVDSDWMVTEGTLDLSVMQFGSKVDGGFSDWTAAIDYSETPDEDGKHGTVTVTINIASLTMGSVTDQAKDTDYFDLANHPTATFEADILRSDAGHIAEGTLTVKDQTVPVSMPFDLTLSGDTAEASGGLRVDRRDFLIGMGTQDDATLSFAVEIAFALTATRGDADQDVTEQEVETTALPEAEGWAVTQGTLGLGVSQFGSTVDGSFAEWTADIDYNETPDDAGKHGSVTATIDIASLTLGSVTADAKGPDYFDLENHPTARLIADIMATETGQSAVGTLTIKDQTVPVEMPFDLSITDNVATASGTLILDRRDFLIGMGTQDEGTLGFSVDVRFDLTAEYN
ncbi:MAG: YceI family protein [Pseudomonadota bacterium]